MEHPRGSRGRRTIRSAVVGKVGAMKGDMEEALSPVLAD